MMGGGPSALRDFLTGCLTRKDTATNFLYFKASDVLPIQNLMENLIWNMLNTENNSRTINQSTVGLLFLYLTNHTELFVHTSPSSYEQELVLKILSYIDTSYRAASLTEFATTEKADIYTLSRILKKETGRSFKELLQEKRLERACTLLTSSHASVADIAASVGYENTSFFHRLFRRVYGVSPRDYRITSRS
jgi:AraC-like DNA-binding protein